jgi:hypothetical protein
MSDISNQALTVFVTTQFVNVSALFADYLIMKAGLPAITELSTKYPIIGGTIILFECLSPISLGVHFWYYPGPTHV